jgi:hypothetical protein
MTAADLLLAEPDMEIEEVATLPTLEQRAELGPEQLLGLERHDR